MGRTGKSRTGQGRSRQVSISQNRSGQMVTLLTEGGAMVIQIVTLANKGVGESKC